MQKYVESLLDQIYQCDPFDTLDKIILFSVLAIFASAVLLVWLNC